MKLTDLLKAITPLPWGNDPDQAVAISTKQAMADATYSTHAANVLPELVGAVRVLLKSTPVNPDLAAPSRIVQWRSAQELLIQSLARAEEVRVGK